MHNHTLHLVYLDEYHAGDRLLLDRLGRGLSSRPGTRLLIVHDPAEAVRSALEGAGVFDTAAATAEANLGLVERAVRVSNKRIVGQLTEAGAPAVGVLGVDRGLMGGESVTARGAKWLVALCEVGTVPVISPLSRNGPDQRHVFLVEAGQLLSSLAGLVPPGSRIILLNKRDSTFLHSTDGQRLTSVAHDDLRLSDHVHDAAAVTRIDAPGVDIMVTNIDGLFGTEEPIGTRIRPDSRSLKSS